MRSWVLLITLQLYLTLSTSVLWSIEPSRYLPDGATIVDPDKHIVFADLDLDGNDEVVLFYVNGIESQPGTTTLVLRCEAEDCEPLWKDESKEAGWEFLPESGVYTLQQGRQPQIVVFTLVGASCGGLFKVFEARGDTFVEVSGDWAKCQRAVTYEDLDGNGNLEIILDTQRPGTLPTIYEWRESRFELASTLYPTFFTPIVENLVGAFESPDSQYPVSAWLSMYEKCLTALTLQQRMDKAVALSERFLHLLASSQQVQGSERERNRARSTVHLALSDLYAKKAQSSQ